LTGYSGVPLSPSAAVNMADRLPHLTLPFSPDLLWRYGSQFSALTSGSPSANGSGHNGLSVHHGGHHHGHHQNTPSSPHLDVKTHLPGALGIT